MRRVTAGETGNSAAAMSAGTAQVQAAQRRSILRPAGHGPQVQRLIQAHVGVIEATAGEPEAPFDVGRRRDGARFDQAGEAGQHAVDHRAHGVGEPLPSLLPIVGVEMPRHGLHPGGRHVLAVGGKRGITERRYRELHERALGQATMAPGVEGLLEILDRRADLNPPAEHRRGVGHAGKVVT